MTAPTTPASDCDACARVAADDTEPCCLCGSPDVAHRNYRDVPFCQACADPTRPEEQP
ncbi:hypothetical protein PV703_11515 [Streptomyces sp. ME01-24h]|nr:hypothetical protein [Streptomyces sp. ME01-24h]